MIIQNPEVFYEIASRQLEEARCASAQRRQAADARGQSATRP
jgi:hypothetical protein